MQRLVLLCGIIFICAQLRAQDTVYLPLAEVLKIAEQNYPKLKTGRYEQEAARANIKLQQQSIIPQLDAAYQADLATHNNISGMLYPQYVLPISGPPSATNDYSPVTGSAASLLLQWQPGIFGHRRSAINLATAASQAQQSKLEQDVYAHTVKVSNQYLDVVYYRQLLKLFAEDIALSEKQLLQVKVLAKTGLRPGVDTALIEATLSHSRIEWIKVRNAFSGSLAALQESLATDSLVVGKNIQFYQTVPQVLMTDTTEHPFIKTARLNIEESRLKKESISKLTAPQFSVWGTTYARGSGVDFTGAVKTWDGMALNRFNYGLGVQLAVPLLKHAEVKTKLQQQESLIKAEQEKFNQVSLELRTQNRQAEAAMTNALAITRETPVQVHAAEYVFGAMQIRYNTGLVNYTELLQTQSALLKSRIDQLQSQSELWKAVLYKAAVNGNLNTFINQVK